MRSKKLSSLHLTVLLCRSISIHLEYCAVRWMTTDSQKRLLGRFSFYEWNIQVHNNLLDSHVNNDPHNIMVEPTLVFYLLSTLTIQKFMNGNPFIYELICKNSANLVQKMTMSIYLIPNAFTKTMKSNGLKWAIKQRNNMIYAHIVPHRKTVRFRGISTPPPPPPKLWQMFFPQMIFCLKNNNECVFNCRYHIYVKIYRRQHNTIR